MDDGGGFDDRGTPGGTGPEAAPLDDYWARQTGAAAAPAVGGPPPVAPALSWASPPTQPSALSWAPPSPPSPPPPRRRRTALLVGTLAVVIVLVAAGVGVVSTRRHPDPGSGVAPAAFVISSTQATLGQKSAAMTIGGWVSAKGLSVPVQGSGAIDFTTNTFDTAMTVQVPGQAVHEQEVAAGGNVYVTVSDGGPTIAQITGGPNWVAIPTPELGASGVGTGNVDPLTQIQMLEHKGATVLPLGTSSVDGVTVSGFAVTPSMAEEQQQLQREIQAEGIPPAQAAAAQQVLARLGVPTIDVSIDASGLLRQVSVDYGDRSLVAVNFTMTFSDYGTPVHVTVPAASDVVSYSQFLQEARAAHAPSSQTT